MYISHIRMDMKQDIKLDGQIAMKVKELIRKLNKRDKENIVCYMDDDGLLHEITVVEPIISYDMFTKKYTSKTYVK